MYELQSQSQSKSGIKSLLFNSFIFLYILYIEIDVFYICGGLCVCVCGDDSREVKGLERAFARVGVFVCEIERDDE